MDFFRKTISKIRDNLTYFENESIGNDNLNRENITMGDVPCDAGSLDEDILVDNDDSFTNLPEKLTNNDKVENNDIENDNANSKNDTLGDISCDDCHILENVNLLTPQSSLINNDGSILDTIDTKDLTQFIDDETVDVVNQIGDTVLGADDVANTDVENVFNAVVVNRNTNKKPNSEIDITEMEVNSENACNLNIDIVLDFCKVDEEIKESKDTGLKSSFNCNNQTKTGVRTTIDDETLQNIKEFEESLINFKERACVDESSVDDIIDLDEFCDLIDEMDADNPKGKVERETNNGFRGTLPKSDNSVNNLSANDENEIISISSTQEDVRSQNSTAETFIIDSVDKILEDSDCDGYNSSDFEFISENEAHMDGFIVNLNRGSDVGNSSQSNIDPSSIESQNNEVNRNVDEESDPGEGPSGLNKRKNEFEDRSYRNNHVVPEGDEYFNLFRGIYSPAALCEIYFMENKSVRVSAMNVMYEGVGFDKQLALIRIQPPSSEDEFEDEANEVAKRILDMYPDENRKRRKRRR